MHEQELFKLAAKSDASADLEQVTQTFKITSHSQSGVYATERGWNFGVVCESVLFFSASQGSKTEAS